MKHVLVMPIKNKTKKALWRTHLPLKRKTWVSVAAIHSKPNLVGKAKNMPFFCKIGSTIK